MSWIRNPLIFGESGLKKKAVDLAKEACLEHHLAQMAGRPGNSLQYRL
jgi:hypothetical protein